MQGVPDWNPGASPQMTYSGNGVWTITLNLLAGKEIKFLVLQWIHIFLPWD